MKQIDLPLYKFYLIEGMTQEDLNELALERNNLSEEVYRLNNIINELEKWCNESMYDDDQLYENVLDKLQELKGSNEPSFEEMVGFVENVYKDIKSQSTLHEELEKERKTIAKIVGDFKEVNK